MEQSRTRPLVTRTTGARARRRPRGRRGRHLRLITGGTPALASGRTITHQAPAAAPNWPRATMTTEDLHALGDQHYQAAIDCWRRAADLTRS